MLVLCFWWTILFLLSVLAVTVLSLFGFLPGLEAIGSSPAGLGLSLFWLLGFIAMIIHILTALYAMIRARHWLWLVFSLLLAPLTTLYYYWFVYPRQSPG